MSMQRREFLELGTAASFLAALGLPAVAADTPTVAASVTPRGVAAAELRVSSDAERSELEGLRELAALRELFVHANADPPRDQLTPGAIWGLPMRSWAMRRKRPASATRSPRSKPPAQRHAPPRPA